MPSFGGTDIFGITVKMATVDNPRGQQQNTFPGVSGIESLDQGFRGRFTTVSGQLVGANPFDLNGALLLFRSFNDGEARDLVDTFGNLWANVKYGSFELIDKVGVYGGSGIYFQFYTARFEHLTA